MTRSSAVLDLDAVSAGHAILYCPANHSVPFEVLAVAGSPGYESVANCLGTPEARARTTGMVARMG
jgi:D-serine deaminase-like pyridoxal phosphate-dependent protein